MAPQTPSTTGHCCCLPALAGFNQCGCRSLVPRVS